MRVVFTDAMLLQRPHPWRAVRSLRSLQRLALLEHAAARAVGRQADRPENARRALLDRERCVRTAHLRANPAGTDGVHEDAARFELLGEQSRHHDDRGLAGTVTAGRFL